MRANLFWLNDEADEPEPPEQVAVDSTHTAAPAVEKRGGGAGDRRHGGRNSKVYALVDEFCGPWVIISRLATSPIARWGGSA
jgi:hypothetical protein